MQNYSQRQDNYPFRKEWKLPFELIPDRQIFPTLPTHSTLGLLF